jgi:hypothetical protein
MQEKIEQTFIPSGFDTLDLINISTGQKQWNSEEFLSFISSQTQPVRMKLVYVLVKTQRPNRW